ncbi:OPY2 protein [Purpureocillium lilacinum]|uniref:OPY2 protein n=1 Tax=Purpureocillium lilacinum TaxID=33203 RepID=A0A179GA05_PURLI|nr:OPY2 protein [Purpureocillium lilacinum]
MEVEGQMFARNLVELSEALKHVPSKRGCVQCDGNAKLQCPSCPSGQSCQFSVPTDCTQCPAAVCLPNDTTPPPSNNGGKSGGDSGPNVGPIAGGVVGGVAAIAILTYLVWRFLIRPKRSSVTQSIYEPSGNSARDMEKDNASRITHRSSTHTVHSIASTVLTRASNIIQIAYIPGVTNRATPTSPTVLVPPVPPIPMHHSDANRASNQDDQHFFVPGNLRDSTYSGISEFSDRTSYAPRSSIASTIYGKQAQIQTPAQTGMRAKPTVVSVKSGNASGANTPPVPSIDFERFGAGRPQSNASVFSVGSTFVNNANTATQARAQVVKLGGGLKKIDVGAKPEASVSSTSLASTSSPAPSAKNATGEPHTATVSDASPTGDLGPFSDPPATPKTVNVPKLVAVMEDDEEPARSGSRTSKRSPSAERGRSPFGDEHATKE